MFHEQLTLRPAEPKHLRSCKHFVKHQDLEFFARQLWGGPAWIVGSWKDGAVALFGLFRREDGYEAWFKCSEAAPRYMIGVAFAMRRLLRGPADPITCSIKPGHVPGERMAKLLGFRPTGELFHAPGTPVDGVQFWRYEPHG